MKYNWFGIDASLETSLFEYGFIMQYDEENEEYNVWYRNDYGPDRFSYSCFNVDEWVKHIESNDYGLSPEEMGAQCEETPEEYLRSIKSSPALLISDLLCYLTPTDLFGTDYSGGISEEEMCKRFKGLEGKL